MSRIIRIAVWLSVSVDRSALMCVSHLSHAVPPIHDAIVALLDVRVKHGVEEELTCESVAGYQVDGTLTLCDLRLGTKALSKVGDCPHTGEQVYRVG